MRRIALILLALCTFASAALAADPVDVNSAGVDQLKALPGITAELASAIVKGRPYDQKEQLVKRKILTQAAYDKIKDAIVAKAPPPPVKADKPKEKAPAKPERKPAPRPSAPSGKAPPADDTNLGNPCSP